jgi:hypothetical protein
MSIILPPIIEEYSEEHVNMFLRDLNTWAYSIRPSVIRQSLDRVQKTAMTRWRRHSGRTTGNTVKITVDYLRHKGSDYDAYASIITSVDFNPTFMVLKYVVLLDIALLYPKLKPECVRQWRELSDARFGMSIEDVTKLVTEEFLGIEIQEKRAWMTLPKSGLSVSVSYSR